MEKGQASERRKINSWVPQGSVSGLLLFLIYINDLPDGLFDDDTTLFSKGFNIIGSADDLKKMT